MRIFPNFAAAAIALQRRIENFSNPIHTEQWQSTPIADRPEASMRELVFEYIRVQLSPKGDLQHYRDDIQPNLPWADRHFEEERASGEPINPGKTWEIWPWATSADAHRTQGEKYSHSYAERYWPKTIHPRGVRFDVGDLNDVVALMLAQPQTRQAYLPVWFPEDTGVIHGERVPCTIGYHFLHRDPYLHVHYEIRSCDFVRHWRDDCYLTVRLLLWLLERLRQAPAYADTVPGLFSMFMGSLHCFEGDMYQLRRASPR